MIEHVWNSHFAVLMLTFHHVILNSQIEFVVKLLANWLNICKLFANTNSTTNNWKLIKYNVSVYDILVRIQCFYSIVT